MGPSSLQVRPAHRKGHKYKHSSVSMNLFQEPPPALNAFDQTPSLPDLYPFPNFKETIASMTQNQKSRLSWAMCHMGLASIVFLFGFKNGLPSFSTLSHLIFYDALGCFVIVGVDIMSNFEVWNNSSIVYPFGLGRLEVLVAFALSASSIMVGFDLISHFLEEMVIILVFGSEGEDSTETHQSHHVHGKQGSHPNWFSYEFMLLATVFVTLITSKLILAYDKINTMISSSEEMLNSKNKDTSSMGILDRSEYYREFSSKKFNVSFKALQRFLSMLANYPTHLLTLSYALILTLVPLVPTDILDQLGIDFDDATSLAISSMLCYHGWNLVKLLGGTLLLSYPRSEYDYDLLKSSIANSIASLDCFRSSYYVDKLFITKFNYELFVVGVRLIMKGSSSDEEARVKFEINRLVDAMVRNSEENSRSFKIEVTIDIQR